MFKKIHSLLLDMRLSFKTHSSISFISIDTNLWRTGVENMKKLESPSRLRDKVNAVKGFHPFAVEIITRGGIQPAAKLPEVPHSAVRLITLFAAL